MDEQPGAVLGRDHRGRGEYAFTPSIVSGSSFACNVSRTTGSARAAAAPATLICAFHSSGVFGKTFQVGLMGAPMILCICGLTVVGTGRVRAGASRGAGIWACDVAAPTIRPSFEGREPALHQIWCDAWRQHAGNAQRCLRQAGRSEERRRAVKSLELVDGLDGRIFRRANANHELDSQ
jgi:hypothetical protein